MECLGCPPSYWPAGPLVLFWRSQGRKQELAREAAALEADFLAGRWMLDQPAWELAAGQIAQWTGRPLPLSVERRAFSAVADWLWDQWQRNRGERLPASSRRLVVVEQTPVTLLGRTADAEVVTLASRRRVLSLGLAAIVLLLAGGSYLLWRVLQRELAVARLQTDFVSAVSHEFRTPLTSLRHVTELLEEDDDLPRDRRRSFYETLGRNTDRLHRLVESLLDFARMEGGKKPYDLQPVDAGQLAAQVIADFQKDAGPGGFAIDLDVVDPGALELRADSASLTHALWNLLDNAVKYSPERHTVRVSVHRHPAGVAISVRDEGLGIPRHEQKEIFRRFVRGAKANQLGIKGTGLGLAMVSHVVHAHGGAIELESEEGVGSTFRLVLPARAPAAHVEREPASREGADRQSESVRTTEKQPWRAF